MKRLSHRIICALTLMLAVVPARARADFYSLEGRFQCLGQRGAVCFDAKVLPPVALLDAPAAPPESRDSEAAAALAPPRDIAESAMMSATPQAPLDPILAIARRVKLARVEAGDIQHLSDAAAAGDRRALELLAWCTLHGIGTARAPVEAYILYGKAATAEIPRARENQVLIFERDLTSNERQRLLELEARRDPASRPLAALK